MKIGILTFQKTLSNYGAALQCFALYKYITNMGFHCEVIDLLRPEHADFLESRLYPRPRVNRISFKRLFASILRRIKPKHIHVKLTRSNIFHHNQSRISNFESFNNVIRYSKQYRMIDELYTQPPNYDLYIVGSDQVWNPLIGFNIAPYFLDFVPLNSVKISYAASIGVRKLSRGVIRNFMPINSFNYISVRENEAIKPLKKIVKKKIDVVLDPVFLLSREQWSELFSDVEGHKLPYIFVYTVAENIELLDYAKKVGEKNNLRVIATTSTPPKFQYLNMQLDMNAGPLEWLKYLKEAELVITDSFHGLSFSLIFNKLFLISIASSARSSRITNMLDTLELNNRVVNLHESKIPNVRDMKINYEDVNKRIQCLVEHSMDFLNNNLK